MEAGRVIPVHVATRIDAAMAEASSGVPTSVYRTANYVVVDAGLPRCLAAHIRVTVAPGAVLVEAERHAGEQATDESRDYLVDELPNGTVRRCLQFPFTDLALGAADAHFANGMLTVSIPTVSREEYRRRIRAESDE